MMNVLTLAPDVQEASLFLPPVTEGHDPVKEWMLRPITKETNWGKQRRMWAGDSAVCRHWLIDRPNRQHSSTIMKLTV